jgi:ParB family chromosome partitioning protein
MKMEYRKLSSLKMNVYNDQVFRNLAPDEIQELADSIKQNGLINPITIKPDGTIIAGHQRYRACCYAFGKDHMTEIDIPVIILDVDDRASFRIWISENIHRRNLSTRESVMGNYLLVLDRIAQMRGLADSNGFAVTTKTLERFTEGELTKAIADLVAGGEVRGKDRTIRRHVLIASGLINDLQELVFSDQLTMEVGATLAALSSEQQQHIATMIKDGKVALKDVEDLQRGIKSLDREKKDIERDYKKLQNQLERLSQDHAELANVQLEQAKREHQLELDRLHQERKELEERISNLSKQAELIATKAKYDKLINSVLLLDAIAMKGSASEAMASRLQFGIYDDAFIAMMDHVSQFLASCAKEAKKQAFQERGKPKVLPIAR